MRRSTSCRVRRPVVAGLLTAAIASLSVGTAWPQGCGPTRLKVAERVTLDLTPDEAWRLVGDFQNLTWDRAVGSVTGEGGNTPDKALRHVVFADHGTMDESLYQYSEDAKRYAFHVDKLDGAALPVQNLSVTIEVTADPDGRHSVLTWRGAFYRLLRPGEPAPDVADAAARNAVVGFAHAQLAGLRKPVGSRS